MIVYLVFALHYDAFIRMNECRWRCRLALKSNNKVTYLKDNNFILREVRYETEG